MDQAQLSKDVGYRFIRFWMHALMADYVGKNHSVVNSPQAQQDLTEISLKVLETAEARGYLRDDGSFEGPVYPLLSKANYDKNRKG